MPLTYNRKYVILRKKKKKETYNQKENQVRIRKPAEEIWPDAGSTSYDLSVNLRTLIYRYCYVP